MRNLTLKHAIFDANRGEIMMEKGLRESSWSSVVAREVHEFAVRGCAFCRQI
jgi:hypothetical protein